MLLVTEFRTNKSCIYGHYEGAPEKGENKLIYLSYCLKSSYPGVKCSLESIVSPERIRSVLPPAGLIYFGSTKSAILFCW